MFDYENWIKLRESSIDERGECLCYCGHTYKCTCSHPDLILFNESVKKGTIINDINNGWKNMKKEREVFTVTHKEFDEMLWGNWKIVEEEKTDRESGADFTEFVFERLSDGKFFSGEAWMLDDGGYIFWNDDTTTKITEVFKTTITTIKETWA